MNHLSEAELEAWPADAKLAAIMARISPPAPVEIITQTDWLVTATNRDALGPDMTKRVAILECGHRVVTRNRKRAQCPACHQMILEGRDYDKFRNRR